MHALKVYPGSILSVVPPPPQFWLHWTITPTKVNVPLALNVPVYEFPVVLSVDVHVPTISPAVPLERVNTISVPVTAPELGNVMVVAVIVTPVLVSVPKSGPSHVKSELVQLSVSTPVVEFHV